MSFIFELVNRDGRVFDWIYDSSKNVLKNADGAVAHMIEGKDGYGFVKNSLDPDRMHVRISMGVLCNNHCAYCSQNEIKEATIRQGSTYETFAKAVVAYVGKHFPEKKSIDFSYWGGEPLLYFDGIKVLTECFQDLLGADSHFSLCTNGKLLKGEKAKWLYDKDFRVAVSHDGPGQFVRDSGADIFAPGSEILECFKVGMTKERPYAVNPVFHKHNPSAKAYVEYMSELLGTDTFRIGEALYICAHDDQSADFVIPVDQMREDAFDIIDMMFDRPDSPISKLYYTYALRWLQRLNTQDRVFCFAQDQKNFLPVDISGNVWCCHNGVSQHYNGYGDPLYRGNIFSGDHCFLDLSEFRKHVNKSCSECVMRWLCGGGCLYPRSKYWEVNCRSRWYRNLPTVVLALYLASDGGRLRRIIRQPGV